MSHAPRTLYNPTPKTIDADGQETPGAVAWVGILNKTGRPGLFVPEVRPGDQVFFGTLSTTSPIEVRFDQPSPFVDGRTQFTVFPGPSIPVTVRSDAEGEFRFVFRQPNSGQNSQILILDVAASGSSSRLEFLSTTSSAAVVRTFVPSSSRNIEVLVQNSLDQAASVSLDGPGLEPSVVSLSAGGAHTMSVRAPGFGKIFTVQLAPSVHNDVQSGGTEQVDIILEPD